jgi:hypothetical protein
MTKLLLPLALLIAVVPLAALAEEKEPADSIKVEIRGTLETDIVAIGGESTGTVIHVGKVTWELDLGGNAMLLKLAKELNKKSVLVTGVYQQAEGVEIPIRHIVKVTSLKPAK